MTTILTFYLHYYMRHKDGNSSKTEKSSNDSAIVKERYYVFQYLFKKTEKINWQFKSKGYRDV